MIQFQVEMKNFAGNWLRLGKPCENHGDAAERIKRLKQGDRKHSGEFEYRITEVENASLPRT